MLPFFQINSQTKLFKIVLALFLLVLPVFLSSSVLAQEISWTGAGDGTSWEDPNNWNPTSVPSLDADVSINANPGEAYTIVLSSDISINSLNLSISQATLDLQAALTIAATMNQTAGRVSGSGDLIVQGELTWRGGRMEGNATAFLNGGAEITGGAGSSSNNKTLDQRRLVVPNGQVYTFNGSLFTGQNGAVIEIQEGGLFDLVTNSSNNVMRVGEGGASIVNAGTFSKSQGTTAQINIEWDLENSGLLSISQPDSELRWWGGLLDQGGRYIVELGFLSFDLPASDVPYLFTPDSQLLAGPGARINLGSRDGDGSETIYELQGSVEMGGIFSVKNFNGASTAVATIVETANLVSLGEELLLVGSNRGRLVVETTDPISVGGLTVGSLARLELSSPLTVSGDYTQNNASGVMVSNFNITVQGELAWSGGRMEGNGTTLINGGATITGGAGSSGNNKTLDQRRLVVPNGQVFTFNGSSFTGQNGAAIDIQEGALFDLITNSSSNVMRVGTGGATIVNAGTISKSQGSTFQTIIEWDLENSGLLSVSQTDAELQWQGALTDNGGQYVVELGFLDLDLPASAAPYVFTPDSRLLAGPGARINLGSSDGDGSETLYELQGSVEMDGIFSIKNFSGGTTARVTIPATANLVSLGGELLLVGASRGRLFVEVTDPISVGDLIVGSSGRLQLGSPLTVTGSYTQNNSSAVIASDFDVTVQGQLSWSGGRMEGSGTTFLDGGAVITGGAGSSGNNKTLDQRRMVVPNGQVFSFNGALFTGQNGAIIEIQEGGVFDLVTNSSNNVMRVGEGGATIINAGTISKSQGSTFQINIEWDLVNSGLLSISQQDADLRLWQSSLIDEGGQYIVEQGFLNFELGPSDTPYVFTPESRLFAGAGAWINLGNRTSDGSSISYELQGSVEMLGTFSVRGNNTAIATILATANLLRLGEEGLLVGGNRGQLYVDVTDPLSVGNLSVGFAGLLELSSPLTVTGDYTQNNASAVVASDFEITVQGGMAWSGGRMEGAGTTFANSGITITGGTSSGNIKVLDQRRLAIPEGQTAVYSGVRLTGSNGAVLEILEGAVLDMSMNNTFRVMLAGEGGATIRNAGTIRKTVGTTAQIVIEWTLENLGTFEIIQDEADLLFSDLFNNTGAINILSETAILESIEPIINDGEISGVGVIKGTLENRTGTVSPGINSETTGILTIQGTFVQSATGTLTLKIGGTAAGTEFDRLVTGTSTIDGTLNLIRLNDYTFSGVDEVKPLTWNEGSQTGAFANLIDDFTGNDLSLEYSPDGLIVKEQTLSVPGIVQLSSPAEGAVGVSISPELAWDPATDAETYQLQLSLDNTFTNVITDQNGISATNFQAQDLSYETVHYWRVRAVNEAGQGEWSSTWTFTTGENPFRPFITTWKTDNPGGSEDNQIRISMIGTGYDFTIDWGDGTTEEIQANFVQLGGGFIEHTYEEIGTYQVQIIGAFPRIFLFGGFSADSGKILSIDQWGDVQWSSMERAFQYTPNLIINATDAPDLSNVTSMKNMFSNASSMNSDLNHWDVSSVENMEELFFEAEQFNGDISSWETGNVTNMRQMFTRASSFNRNIGAWNTVNVTNMIGMFGEASSFNQDISSWNTENVISMLGMFTEASAFNQAIVNWNTGNVISMASMFNDALAFDQDLGGWDITSVTDMGNMLRNSSLSVENYDNTLIGWESQSVQNGVELGANGLEYCAATEARENLITTYSWDIRFDSQTADCNGNTTPPSIVILSSPEDGATGVSINPQLVWEPAVDAGSYQVQLSTEENFTTLIVDQSGITETQLQVENLSYETVHYWRVRSVNKAAQGEWSAVWSFTTEFTQPETPVNFVLSQQNQFPRLTWEVSTAASDHRFNIYRGVTPRALELIETVDADVLSFVDEQIPEGIYFYAVSSVSPGGSESEKTYSLSYVNEFLQAEAAWKLTSIPIADSDIDAELATLYRYDEKYYRENRLISLEGYWMKTRSFDTENIFVNGPGLLNTNLNLEKGWNLIGSLSDSLHVDMIVDPGNILTDAPIYIYESDSYVATNYLVPNQGHWIFAEEAGTVNISVQNDNIPDSNPAITSGQNQAFQIASQQRETEHSTEVHLVIENGHSLTHLHIRNTPVETSALPAYYLPPLSPEPVLDVRVENNTNLLQSDMERVFVKSSEYPLKLTIESETNEVAAYRLHAYSNSEKTFSVDLVPGQAKSVVEEFEYFTMELIAEDEIVQADQLISNYPNPFNPSTTIQFELAQTTQVRLEVFDVVGRRVSLLAAEQFQAGQHFVTFRADNLSSGIYFIRFQTPQTVSLRKITLMK